MHNESESSNSDDSDAAGNDLDSTCPSTMSSGNSKRQSKLLRRHTVHIVIEDESQGATKPQKMPALSEEVELNVPPTLTKQYSGSHEAIKSIQEEAEMRMHALEQLINEHQQLVANINVLTKPNVDQLTASTMPIQSKSDQNISSKSISK